MERKNPATPAKPGPVGLAPNAKPKVVVELYTFRKIGLPYVRKAATVFGISLLLSIALVTGVRVVLFKVRPGTAQAQQAQQAANDRFNEAEIERDEIRAFYPKFEQLRARGFFGLESRLAMLEAIKSIRDTRRLLPITYEFAPQQIVAVDPTLLGPPLELHSTSVHLSMGMLHELDLINFLQDLKSKGFFTVKECTVSDEHTVEPGPLAPRLLADCTLFWLTVSDALPIDPATGLPVVSPLPTGG